MFEVIFEVPVRKSKEDENEFTGGNCPKNGRDIFDIGRIEL